MALRILSEYAQGLPVQYGRRHRNREELEIDFPGRRFVVIPVGPLDTPSTVTGALIPTFESSTAP